MPDNRPSAEISDLPDIAVALIAVSDRRNGYTAEQIAEAQRELERREISPDQVHAIISNYALNAEPVSLQIRPGCIPRWVPKAAAIAAVFPFVLVIRGAIKHPEGFRRGVLIWRWFLCALAIALVLLAGRQVWNLALP